MRLVMVMRHGEAEERAASDFDRRLTPAGQGSVVRACELLRSGPGVPRRVLASPLVRAQETARIVAETLSLTSPPETSEDIRPDGNCESVASSLMGESGIIMLVTHQPFASRFVEFVTGVHVPMKTACIAGIESRPDQLDGTLAWVL